MKRQGWIALYRNILDSAIWHSYEPYDRRSAWIWMLLQSAHEDDELFNGKGKMVLKSGEFLTSTRRMAEVWDWSNDKVLRFLALLEREKMICKQRMPRNGTLISIANWAFYQGEPNANRTQTERQPNANRTSDANRTQTEHKSNAECDTNRTPKTLMEWGFYRGEPNANRTLIDTPMDTLTKEKRETKETKEKQEKERTKERELKESKESKESKENIYISVSNETDCRFPEIDPLSQSPKPSARKWPKDLDNIVEAWNELESKGLKPVRRIDPNKTLCERVRARVRECGEDEVVSVVKSVGESSFLTGRNNKGWMATFDWAMRPNNFEKIQNGNYADKAEESQSNPMGYSAEDLAFLERYKDE